MAAVTRSRLLRALLTLLVTGLCVAYLAWKIELDTTLEVLGDADLGYFLAAAAIMLVSTVPLAWRWQRLLGAKGVDEPLGWLTRTYFVSYTAGQVLPTSIGGDAVRAFETARRHPGQAGLITGSVLLDRALGGAATLMLAAVGLALAVGEYDVGAYLWLELLFVLGTIVLAVTTGTGLLATKATEYVGNPFLYIKLPAIAIGFANALMLTRSAAWQARGMRELSRGEDRQLAWMGGTSLACWLTAVGAERMIGYW